LFDYDGNILHRDFRKLDNRQGKEVGKLVTGCLKELTDIAESWGGRVSSAGISIPGISHIGKGTVWAPNIPGWNNYPLMKEVKEITGDIPVVIDSDRSCHIMGEVWKGNASGCRNAVYMAVGTGIGAGILANGEILRGNNDISGAIGWMSLDRPFRDEYKQCGCFEYHASGEGIAKVARYYISKDKSYNGILSKQDPCTLTSHEVIHEFRKGDPLAEKVISEAVQYWGMAAANLISLLNPEKIIFGGGLFGPLKYLIADIKAEAIRWAQPIAAEQVIFDASALEGDAAIFGAGYMALRNINTQ
ncbi:MAG TPA: ROK family protein, partial [Bacteroidales bacterium]|nr:ROK family protein [Bacteroidales bacterium]